MNPGTLVCAGIYLLGLGAIFVGFLRGRKRSWRSSRPSLPSSGLPSWYGVIVSGRPGEFPILWSQLKTWAQVSPLPRLVVLALDGWELSSRQRSLLNSREIPFPVKVLSFSSRQGKKQTLLEAMDFLMRLPEPVPPSARILWMDGDSWISLERTRDAMATCNQEVRVMIPQPFPSSRKIGIPEFLDRVDMLMQGMVLISVAGWTDGRIVVGGFMPGLSFPWKVWKRIRDAWIKHVHTSGEDVFLIQLAHQLGFPVSYLWREGVWTESSRNLAHWFQRRIRWASKIPRMRFSGLILGILVWIFGTRLLTIFWLLTGKGSLALFFWFLEWMIFSFGFYTFGNEKGWKQWSAQQRRAFLWNVGISALIIPVYSGMIVLLGFRILGRQASKRKSEWGGGDASSRMV